MKDSKNLKSFEDLNKDELIDQMLTSTVKGGCCHVLEEVVITWDTKKDEQD